MEWFGKEAFVSSSEKPFTVDGKEAGVLKSHGPLSFLKVWPHIKHTIFVPFSQSAVFFLNKINSHLHNVCYLFYVTSLLLKKKELIWSTCQTSHFHKSLVYKIKANLETRRECSKLKH
jgi:hypothetical protein